MNKIVVDEATRAKLAGIERALQLCDESGVVLGTFYPTSNGSHDDEIEPPISAEELAQRKRETSGRTLNEILADLEKRA